MLRRHVASLLRVRAERLESIQADISRLPQSHRARLQQVDDARCRASQQAACRLSGNIRVRVRCDGRAVLLHRQLLQRGHAARQRRRRHTVGATSTCKHSGAHTSPTQRARRLSRRQAERVRRAHHRDQGDRTPGVDQRAPGTRAQTPARRRGAPTPRRTAAHRARAPAIRTSHPLVPRTMRTLGLSSFVHPIQQCYETGGNFNNFG